MDVVEEWGNRIDSLRRREFCVTFSLTVKRLEG